MAQISSIAKKLVVVAVAFAAFATVSAQEGAFAPAPSPDAGAAFNLPVSGALVGASLVCSAFAMLRH
ncbi:hypothetical protein Leryth_021502 [Lithospermum erythrorhizon]|uniref:Uncharacterized protein n=1 Tax=Lithospermum erythrorhizon TaxID=34254 RepID=A0AAV3QXY6_LITER|nr:hypothetical protein Leryth_021502 [Lithospermum erythrorhizon]